MTVCIAALFRFNYALLGSPPELGVAAIALSDRMVTAGDVEYEPQQLKIAHITPRTIVMIAGEYSIHSQAIQATHKQFVLIRLSHLTVFRLCTHSRFKL